MHEYAVDRAADDGALERGPSAGLVVEFRLTPDDDLDARVALVWQAEDADGRFVQAPDSGWCVRVSPCKRTVFIVCKDYVDKHTSLPFIYIQHYEAFK
ncbi:uncharacterized protein LAESUDRAFT_732961 [Laetiporus sulphureus 93-53]|uniref:Uncharacterized protein n=1 Tax=Laetiporus sulphureus 93-53 TaxID=1314785 RepID=A0A165AUW5_9APHY|nr:uncharacterized protein LAESUDRAFT_732961 [Laetiporus sulphureus 93-53]KZS99708.1 hypothetical protein LAESUDRAFT_732961 [Laetiporus sulphureus 93-53]